MIVRFALAALALAGSTAFAQEGADPKLCASINGILAQTPKDAWPEKPNVTLEWEGGSSACTTEGKGVLACDFFHTQMMSADSCKIYRDDYDREQQTRDVAARAYAQQRSMAAINACFAGSAAAPRAVQLPNQVTQGLLISPAGKPAFRFGESSARLEIADSVCGFSSIGFEFDPAK